MPVRYSRWRLLVAVVLLLLFVALLIAGRLLHWDDQLRLYWSERSVTAEQRAAGIWLPDYELALETTLAGLEDDETSGLTWNPLTGTLFTVTGKHPQLIELTPAGVVLRRIALTGFSDPEAVEALDDGRLAIVDERRRLVAVFRLEPGVESLELDDLASYDLGFAEAGNKGFEGLAYDTAGQRLYVAKERNPVRIYEISGFPFAEPTPSVHISEHQARLFVRDLSSLQFDEQTGHLLALSDESRLVVELDADGQPLSSLSLSAGRHGLERDVPQAEGMAMGPDGTLYLVSEPNLFYSFRREEG